MIILIAGASHTGKTAMAQKLLEKYKYPYLSIDHLKMGLIRSGKTELTPTSEDSELTAYLWDIVREMIKTAIENNQNLIVEGCYIPYDWAKDFEDKYLDNIKYYCLVMSEKYIRKQLEKMIIYSDKYLKSRGEMSPFKRMTTALFSPHMNFNDAKWFMFASSTKNIISTQRELMEYLYFGFNIYDIVLPDNVPMFFIQGDCDYITPTDMVQEFYDSIKVNSTDMIIIEKAGHTPFLDNPEVFCESVKKCNSVRN